MDPNDSKLVYDWLVSLGASRTSHFTLASPLRHLEYKLIRFVSVVYFARAQLIRP